MYASIDQRYFMFMSSSTNCDIDMTTANNLHLTTSRVSKCNVWDEETNIRIHSHKPVQRLTRLGGLVITVEFSEVVYQTEMGICAVFTRYVVAIVFASNLFDSGNFCISHRELAVLVCIANSHGLRGRLNTCSIASCCLFSYSWPVVGL